VQTGTWCVGVTAAPVGPAEFACSPLLGFAFGLSLTCMIVHLACEVLERVARGRCCCVAALRRTHTRPHILGVGVGGGVGSGGGGGGGGGEGGGSGSTAPAVKKGCWGSSGGGGGGGASTAPLPADVTEYTSTLASRASDAVSNALDGGGLAGQPDWVLAALFPGDYVRVHTPSCRAYTGGLWLVAQPNHSKALPILLSRCWEWVCALSASSGAPGTRCEIRTPALLVGVSMTDDACPFTMTDGANDGFVLVSAQECACAGVLLCACVCVCVGVCVLVRFSCRGCVEPLLSQPGMRELLLCRVVLCHTS
jgi:hypothetical protein